VDVDLGLVEGDGAVVVVTKEANGEERTGGQMWEDMAVSGSVRESRELE
jgi:hypothetical protein